jgi:hypothetical protein
MRTRRLNARTTRCRSVCHCFLGSWIVAARPIVAGPASVIMQHEMWDSKVRQSPAVGARKKPPIKCIPLYRASQKSPAVVPSATSGFASKRAQQYLNLLMNLVSRSARRDRTTRLRDRSHRRHLSVLPRELPAYLTRCEAIVSSSIQHKTKSESNQLTRSSYSISRSMSSDGAPSRRSLHRSMRLIKAPRPESLPAAS